MEIAVGVGKEAQWRRNWKQQRREMGTITLIIAGVAIGMVVGLAAIIATEVLREHGN